MSGPGGRDPTLPPTLPPRGRAQREPLGDGRYRVYLAREANPETLVEAAVGNGWGLYELVPEQQSLEDLFIELTGNEAEQVE